MKYIFITIALLVSSLANGQKITKKLKSTTISGISIILGKSIDITKDDTTVFLSLQWRNEAYQVLADYTDLTFITEEARLQFIDDLNAALKFFDNNEAVVWERDQYKLSISDTPGLKKYLFLTNDKGNSFVTIGKNNLIKLIDYISSCPMVKAKKKATN